MMHRDYREAGFHIFGLHGADANGVCLCEDPSCKAPYKHPISKGWQHTPEWDDQQIVDMEKAGQFDTGFGVLCKGYLVIDVDARNGGVESFQKLNEDLGSTALMSAGLVVRTGSGGGSRHLYFKAPEGISLQIKLPQYPGIDFKSSGYVVGAGSLHESGERYEILIGSVHDIEQAPQVLIDLLRKPESHRTLVNDRQIDVSNNDLVSMLAFIDPNCDHDQWIKCGMAIHHASNGSAFEIWDEWSAKGKTYPGTKQLSKRWDTFGKSERPVTLGTLAHFAELGGWAWPVEFMSDEFAEVGGGNSGLFIPVEEMMSSITKPQWIVKGIIEASSNNLLFGESGAGKSLFALDWAFCIGNGINWHNHKVKQGIVLYIAGEGHRGLTLRMQALSQKYSIAPSNIFFSRKSINFLDEKEASAIVKIVNDMGIKVDLVVIDTLHRNMIGDENKTDDMAKFFKSIELVTKETNAAVITVHHSGHADSDRARGSSSIKAGMDAEFKVAKDGMSTLFSCTKSKDFGAGSDMRFAIKEVELEGEVFFDDDDQKQITSVCLEYVGVGSSEELSKKEQALLSSLRDAIDSHGELTWTPEGEVMAVSLEKWKPFAYEAVGKKNPSRDFQSARNALKNHGVIDNNGDIWWVV